MHTLTRRDVLKALGLGTATMVLAACAPKPTPTPEPVAKPVATEPPTKPAAKEPVTLLWISPLTAEVEMTWTHHWVDTWNEENADIQVRLEDVGWDGLTTKSRAYIAAGEPVDLGTGVGRETYKMGWVEPVADCLADTKDWWRDVFFAKDSSCVYFEDDKMIWIGVPMLVHGNALIVRADYLKNAGITDLMAATATWDDLKETASKLNNPPEVYGWCQELVGGTWSGHWGTVIFQTNGLDHLADFREEKREAYIETLKFMQEMWEFVSPDHISWEWRDAITAYATGMTAMKVTGSWFYGDLVPRDPDLVVREKMAVLPLSNGPSGPGRQVKQGAMGHWIFKQSEHKEEACTFMRFMCEDEPHNSFPMNMSGKKGVSAKAQCDVLNKLFPDMYGPQSEWWYEDWYSAFDDYTGWEAKSYMPSAEIDKIYMDELMNLRQGNTTPEKMYETIKPRIEDIMRELQGRS